MMWFWSIQSGGYVNFCEHGTEVLSEWSFITYSRMIHFNDYWHKWHEKLLYFQAMPLFQLLSMKVMECWVHNLTSKARKNFWYTLLWILRDLTYAKNKLKIKQMLDVHYLAVHDSCIFATYTLPWTVHSPPNSYMDWKVFYHYRLYM